MSDQMAAVPRAVRIYVTSDTSKLVMRLEYTLGNEVTPLADMLKFEFAYAACDDGTLLKLTCHEGRWGVAIQAAGPNLKRVYASKKDGFIDFIELKEVPCWVLVGEDLHE